MFDNRRRDDDYNGLAADLGAVDSMAFTRELLDMESKQRLYLPSTLADTSDLKPQLSVDLEGCFHDFASNSTHCLKPWTTYQVTLRVLGAFLGPGTAVHVTTPRAKPDTPPPVHSAAHDGSASSVVVEVSRPTPLTTVITAFRVAYTRLGGVGGGSREGRGSREAGAQGSFVFNITDADTRQHTSPNQRFAIRIPDLQPWTRYAFEVKAVSEEGESPVAAGSAQTDEAVPSKMDPVVFEEKVARGAWRVAWSPPTPLPGQIVRYDIVLDEDLGEDNSTGPFVFSDNATAATLALDSRQIRIRAVTSYVLFCERERERVRVCERECVCV